jgi:trimethylamine:corrinoid methyltransferase-like protein
MSRGVSDMTEEQVKRRRAGGRAGNKERAGTAVIDQMPWRIPLNPDRPTEPLDEEGVLAIHRGAMRILKEIGIEFLNPDAVTILKKAGCRVDGTNIRMDESFVMEMLAHNATQSGTRGDYRRQTYGVRQRVVAAKFMGLGTRQTVWRFRVFQRIHEADPILQLHTYCRGISG